ncbi:MAG: hypothetical protein KDB03_06525 [Planctomycetales bacterium]|nr:hypothetical protein [Planctomycetales bacterium]
MPGYLATAAIPNVERFQPSENRLNMDVKASAVHANRQTSDHWTQFSAHRERCTSLIVNCIRRWQDNSSIHNSRPAVALLGAGNCNDVDLSELSGNCSSIDLIDIDESATASAIHRQGNDHLACVVRSSKSMDLSGIQSVIPQPSSSAALDRTQINEVAFRLRQLPFETHSFDIVVSCCVLSQLIKSTCNLVEIESESWPLIATVRLRHLQNMVDWLEPNGMAILFTDMVSSETCPELTSISETSLELLQRKLIEAGNFFSGLNPKMICRLIESGALSSSHEVEVQEVIPPWVWNMGARHYLVYAVLFALKHA